MTKKHNTGETGLLCCPEFIKGNHCDWIFLSRVLAYPLSFNLFGRMINVGVILLLNSTAVPRALYVERVPRQLRSL